MNKNDLRTLITTEAHRLGIDPFVALSLAHQESGFNPNAVSPTGVVGLFQVTNATGRPYGQTPQTRTDPTVSARAGLSYFKDLLKATGGDTERALTRYNGGSDPRFAQNVLRHVAGHRLFQDLYGEQPMVGEQPMTAKDLLADLYGPQP